MIKLKDIIKKSLNELSMGYGSMSSNDKKLNPTPGGFNDKSSNWNKDAEDWNGIVEGKDWFCYLEGNDWHNKRSGATVYINEGDKPHKIWIKIKTHGLRKPTDTNESFKERIRKHTNKVARNWMKTAKDIHNKPDLNEVGNPVTVTWKQAFLEALHDPKVKMSLADCGEQEIAPITDPMNFTPRK